MPMTLNLNMDPDVVPAISARFRHASPVDIRNLCGERVALVRFLAKTHDLTTSEADEMLENCLAVGVAPLTKAA